MNPAPRPPTCPRPHPTKSLLLRTRAGRSAGRVRCSCSHRGKRTAELLATATALRRGRRRCRSDRRVGEELEAWAVAVVFLSSWPGFIYFIFCFCFFFLGVVRKTIATQFLSVNRDTGWMDRHGSSSSSSPQLVPEGDRGPMRRSIINQ